MGRDLPLYAGTRESIGDASEISSSLRYSYYVGLRSLYSAYFFCTSFTLAVPKMPAGTIVHAAFFAVGALVGGGVAAAVATGRRQAPVAPPTQPTQPVLDVKGGTVTQVGSLSQIVLPPVLKYGNPGTYSCAQSDTLTRQLHLRELPNLTMIHIVFRAYFRPARPHGVCCWL